MEKNKVKNRQTNMGIERANTFTLRRYSYYIDFSGEETEVNISRLLFF